MQVCVTDSIYILAPEPLVRPVSCAGLRRVFGRASRQGQIWATSSTVLSFLGPVCRFSSESCHLFVIVCTYVEEIDSCLLPTHENSHIYISILLGPCLVPSLN